MQLSPVTDTFAVLLIDRSTSMRRFAPLLKAGFKRHLDDLKASPGSSSIVMEVWTFGGRGPKLEIEPMPAARIHGLADLTFQGGTPLYTSVAHVLERRLGEPHVPHLKVSLNILTDGDDRGSQPQDLGRLRSLLVPQALQRGFGLAVMGFGVDGIRIARTMGFAGESSISVPATEDGLRTSFSQMTSNTIPPRGK